MKELKNKFIGEKAFYQKVLFIVIPMIVQNAITNFVSLLDNIMVGKTGTDPMNGVAIVNQLFFVFYLCVFGAVSGAGIFSAQYYGKGDNEGVRDTFRGKLILVGFVFIFSTILFLLFGDSLISLFLHETDGVGNAQNTLHYGHNYLRIMLIGIFPYVLSSAYSNTLRDTGETVIPMKAGIAAVVVNLILNYILIFGHFHAPRLGVEGAAIATVVSRFVEVSIIMIWTHTHTKQAAFIVGAYKSFRIPKTLFIQILKKGAPLAANEALWSLGMTTLNQCYSIRGLSVVGAFNISSTIVNLFSVVYLALGESISIIVGQHLGANRMEQAKKEDTQLIFFSVAVSVMIGLIMSFSRHAFPSIYNTEMEVKVIAANLILVGSIFMPAWAFLHACYFTLRTGGKTLITFAFDSVFAWLVEVPVIFCLAHFTTIPIIMLYISCQCVEMFKSLIGFILVKKGIWLNNIVQNIE